MSEPRLIALAVLMLVVAISCLVGLLLDDRDEL